MAHSERLLSDMCLFVPSRIARMPRKHRRSTRILDWIVGRFVPFCAREKLMQRRKVAEKNWRPRRDLNPCYRRESNAFVRSSKHRRTRALTVPFLYRRDFLLELRKHPTRTVTMTRRACPSGYRSQ
jgi:hypothetical protein